MKQLVNALFQKSLDSLVLSIEHFNRPWDRGRPEAVLILLDRAFELLLKSIILHRGGKIREPYDKETIGFEKCVRKCITEAEIKCLTEEQGLTIQILNSFRDAAQHDIVELTEQELYLYCQAGVTLYKDLIKTVFEEELNTYIPERVLPISTQPPKSLHSMISGDFKYIQELVRPHSRKQLEAKNKLKAMAIIESSLEGVRSQPSELEVNRLVKEVQSNKNWQEIFPGIASLEIASTGTGINVDIRITKKEGEAVCIVPEGTPGATVLAVKRVNELDYYSISATLFAEKLNITQPKACALAKHLKLEDSEEYFKIIKIGASNFRRFSPSALDLAKKSLPSLDMKSIWENYKKKSLVK
jgi:hypothetical protein